MVVDGEGVAARDDDGTFDVAELDGAAELDGVGVTEAEVDGSTTVARRCGT